MTISGEAEVDDSAAEHVALPARSHVLLVQHQQPDQRGRRRLKMLPALPIATAVLGASAWQFSTMVTQSDILSGLAAMAGGWLTIASVAMGIASIALRTRPRWFAVLGMSVSCLAVAWLASQVGR